MKISFLSRWRTNDHFVLITLLVVSILLRAAAAFAMGNTVTDLPGIFDQISYHNLALRVMGGHGFSFGEVWWPITPADAPTAHWSFLYTLYLVGVYKIFGTHPLAARLLQAIIAGSLHPYITYLLGRKLFGKNIGLLAAGITAFYAYYIYYDAALMTEAFYITAILSGLYLAMLLAEARDKKNEIGLAIALGISIGIAVLLRQVFLMFLPFLFAWLWMGRFTSSRKMPILPISISIMLIVLFIAPVTAYNYSRFGRLVLLNTNSGYAFFWGNHPIYGAKFIPILPEGVYQELIPAEVRSLDEAALDQELMRRSIKFVLDDPNRYLLLSLSRIPAYFMFWPSADSELLSNISRVASFGITWPFMAYGLILALKENASNERRDLPGQLSSPVSLLLIFALIYSVIHLLTWALVRYRLPVDAVLIPFAALALLRIAQQLRILKPSSNPGLTEGDTDPSPTG
jgi:4-amino-4-deoxy-L-arabinose transferase-like glycosyltransferase